MIDFLDLPLSSTVWLILAGILIGHLLWYKDHSGDTKKINGLENRYFKAREIVRQRKQRFLKLQKNSQSQLTDLQLARDELQLARDELQLARDELHSLSTRTRDLQQSSKRTHTELEQLRIGKQSTEELLANEQHRSESLVAQLQEVLQEKVTLQEQCEAQEQTIVLLHADGQQLESELELVRNDLSSQTESTISLQASLDDQTSAATESAERNMQLIGELQSETAALKSALEESSETLAQTQQDLVSSCEHLDAARADHDALDQELAQATQRVTDRDAKLSLANVAKTERDQLATDLESAKKSNAQQSQLLELRDSDLAESHLKLGQLQRKFSATSEQLKQHQSEVRALSAGSAEKDLQIGELRNQIGELLPLREDLGNANLRLADQRADVEQRGELIETQRKELDYLRESLESMEWIKSELASAISESKETNDRYRALQTELQKEQATLVQKQAELQQLTEQVERLKPLQNQLAQAGEKMKRHHESASHLKIQCAAQETEIERLREQSKKIPALQQQLQKQVSGIESTKKQLESITEELATVSNERDKLNSTRSELDSTVSQLRTQVGSQSARVKEVNELLSVKTRAHSRVALDLQKRVQLQTAAVEDLEGQLAAKTERHEQSIRDLIVVTQKFDHRQATVQKLAEQLTVSEKLRPENKALQVRVKTLTGHLKRLGSELEDSLDTNARAQDRARDLENQVHEHAVKIRDLRRQRGSITDIRDDQTGDRAA